MSKLFVPYLNNAPAAVEIKGHRLLIVTTDSDDMVADLRSLGGNAIREIQLRDTTSDESAFLADLAACINGGVVLTPPGVRPSAMVKNLELRLPWIH